MNPNDTTPDTLTNTTEATTGAIDRTDTARLEDIREWLRFHSDYRVTFDLCGVFVTFCFTVSGPDGYHRVSYGKTLRRRLDEVETWLREIDPNPRLIRGLIPFTPPAKLRP